jgi:hypothetical protein
VPAFSGIASLFSGWEAYILLSHEVLIAVHKLQMASSGGLPEALITCVLPEYEEKHIWWLVLQYLEDANFAHTASAFKLELSCKGIKNEFLGLTKVRWGSDSRCGTVGTPARTVWLPNAVLKPFLAVIAGRST